MQITRENAPTELIEIIAENGLTQKEIAEKSGLTPDCIHGIVTRGRKPDTLTVFKINKYLKKFPFSVNNDKVS